MLALFPRVYRLTDALYPQPVHYSGHRNPFYVHELAQAGRLLHVSHRYCIGVPDLASTSQ